MLIIAAFDEHIVLLGEQQLRSISCLLVHGKVFESY